MCPSADLFLGTASQHTLHRPTLYQEAQFKLTRTRLLDLAYSGFGMPWKAIRAFLLLERIEDHSLNLAPCAWPTEVHSFMAQLLLLLSPLCLKWPMLSTIFCYNVVANLRIPAQDDIVP